MNREPKSPAESELSSRLRAAGISDEMMTKAAETANRLCAGAGAVKGGTLDPRSGLEYRALLASLAKGTAR